jgi:NAD(P)-dependent dehydrogenase (short-subunit alcohol dehydrogenase family)
MRVPPVKSRTALVTGCSSGIGAATAHLLRASGWRVFPTARREADCERLRNDGFSPVTLDIADAESVGKAVEAVLALTDGCLGALVNNAGFAQPGALEDIAREDLRRQFEVNVFGVHQLTAALIPAFRQAGAGRIVNVSSVLGRVAVPMLGAYCASKYALEALSDALRVELRNTGIAVSLIEPGPIISAFRRNAAETLTRSMDAASARYGQAYAKEAERRKKQIKRPDLFTRPPEAVAAKILHALEARNPHRRYRVTIPAYVGDWVGRFVPAALTDRLFLSRVPHASG